MPRTVMLAADLFGRRNVGAVYGWIFASHQFAGAIAPWGAGPVRDNVGDYTAAFVAAGWIAIVAGFMALRIGRPTRIPAAAPRRSGPRPRACSRRRGRWSAVVARGVIASPPRPTVAQAP